MRRSHDRVAHCEHRAADVLRADRHTADRLSRRLLARGRRHPVRPARYLARPAGHVAAAGAARAGVRRDVERHAARGPVLHVHGTDPRAFGHGRRLAGHDRPVVRPAARRARVRGRFRRRAAGCDDGRRGRERHLDGADFAAHHAALRIRPPACDRRHRSIRHARPDHPAVARADHHGRPARPLGRRYVRRRVHSRHHARRPVCALCARHDDLQAATGRRRCPRKRGRCGNPTAAAERRR